ncbi:MAG: EcsC family protein [Propioniciclava sp.]
MADKDRSTGKNLVTRAPQVGGSALRQLLDTAISGVSFLPSAKKAAAHHLVRRDSVEDAIDGLVVNHIGLAMAQGFVTNLGGLATVAVALPANMAGVAVLQIRMVAAIAHLRGYDIEAARVRTALAMCLLGEEGSTRLVRTGILPGLPVVVATAPVHDRNLDTVISERLFGELAARLGGRHAGVMLARRIPLLGGGVGGALDAAHTHGIGRFARDQFVSRRPLTRD